uniref:RING-type domain-containing protein n=1 Tax=Tetranychus urticae TaxID=32264 RepID=A0A158P5L4_TETUR
MISPIIENWTCPITISSLNLYLKMKHTHNRAASYSLTELPKAWVDKIITSGFFCKDESTACCYACGLEIGLIFLDTSIHNVHKKLSPECSFVREREFCWNLHLDKEKNVSCFCALPRANWQTDFSAPVTLPVFKIVKNGSTFTKELTDKSWINPEKIYPLYQIRINRFNSFKDAPISLKSKNLLVESGFFWTGHGKVIQCAFCRLGTEGPMPFTPNYFHKILSPFCPFMTEESYDIERSFCCVCLVKNHNVLYLPCSHIAVCDSCDNQLFRNSSRNCPLCRTKIEKRIFCILP